MLQITKRPELTKEFLQEEYINKNKTLQVIADETGYCITTVHKKVKKFNIPIIRNQKHNLEGRKFGNLEVLERDSKRTGGDGHSYWFCKCSCGTVISVLQGNLLRRQNQCCYKCRGAKIGKYEFKYTLYMFL